MFDQLIESEPDGAELKNRRGYFMVSSIVVSILFATAVVIGIYAADIGLGHGSFELLEMIAEVEPVSPDTPDQPSTKSNTQYSPASNAPLGDKFALTTIGHGDCGLGSRGGDGGESSGLKPPIGKPVDVDIEPPPEKKEVASKPPIIVSGGTMNGRATYLPKPVYPATALAVHASGKADVQITIDESGYVISADAISGHPLLRGTAVQAAMKARFVPTYLSNVPVRVRGVIVYNFVR